MRITSLSSWNMAGNSENRSSATFHPPAFFDKSLAVKADNFHKQNNVRFGTKKEERTEEQLSKITQEIEDTNTRIRETKEKMTDPNEDADMKLVYPRLIPILEEQLSKLKEEQTRLSNLFQTENKKKKTSKLLLFQNMFRK
jgi:hypothetical protein